MAAIGSRRRPGWPAAATPDGPSLLNYYIRYCSSAVVCYVYVYTPFSGHLSVWRPLGMVVGRKWKRARSKRLRAGLGLLAKWNKLSCA